MAISMPTTTTKLNFLKLLPSSSPSTKKRVFLKPVHCVPLLQQQQEDARIMCAPCGGRGWLLCDFCNGEKINVKAGNNRIYRRCPSCRAIGYVLCSQCKVYKCVTFPNFSDGESA